MYDSKWSVTTEDEDNIERERERERELGAVKQVSQNPSRLYQHSITAPAGLSKPQATEMATPHKRQMSTSNAHLGF